MHDDIKQLLEGYKNFRQKYFSEDNTLYDDLVKSGQKPKFLIISCSDSRVDPSLILNCKPGDLFVIRNVANLIPAFESDNSFHGTSAALEFGVNILKISNIIIFGHSLCGGINALLSENNILTDKKSFIAKWLELARSTKEFVESKFNKENLETKVNICSQYSVINSMKNLKTFPWIKEKVKEKNLSIYGWYFDLATGIIKSFNEQEDKFLDII